MKTLSIRFTGTYRGADLRPSSLDAVDLVKVLTEMIAAVKAESPDRGRPHSSSHNLLALSRVVDESAGYELACTAEAEYGVARIAAALAAGDFGRLASKTIRALHAAFDPFIKGGATVQIAAGGPARAYNLLNPLPDLAGGAKLVEVTSLLARVTKIGGKGTAAVKAFFYATDQELSAACATRDVAKRMSDQGCLYEDVSLEGKVTWRTEPWRIDSFVVYDFTRHGGGIASGIFGEMAPVLGPSWEGVDPEKYTEAVRGGDDV